MTRKPLLVLVSSVLVGIAVAATPAAADTAGTNCAYLLVPGGGVTASGEIVATPVSLGCYLTYAQALDVGSGGSVQVSASTTPGTLTQATLDASTTLSATSDVTIGTEFFQTGYNGNSHT